MVVRAVVRVLRGRPDDVGDHAHWPGLQLPARRHRLLGRAHVAACAWRSLAGLGFRV